MPRAAQLAAINTRQLAGHGLHTVHLQLGRLEPGCSDCMPPEGRPTLAGLAASWAERQQGEVTALDHQLTEQARLARPAVRWWWGWRDRAGHQGAECYLCGQALASWDRRWPAPATAQAALATHRDQAHGPGA